MYDIIRVGNRIYQLQQCEAERIVNGLPYQESTNSKPTPSSLWIPVSSIDFFMPQERYSSSFCVCIFSSVRPSLNFMFDTRSSTLIVRPKSIKRKLGVRRLRS